MSSSNTTDNNTPSLQNPTEVLAPATNANLDNSQSTSAHPGGPDPTTGSQPPPSFTAKRRASEAQDNNHHHHNPSHAAAQGAIPTTGPAAPAQLTDLKVKLQSNLRQFPDFPQPGILFEDIMPLFASYELHCTLLSALEMLVCAAFDTRMGRQSEIDVVVGLESRGFLFGPTLAMRLGAAFVPVRKAGKLPGETVTEAYEKEYGTDHFQMQADAIQKGQKVVVVDDIIATGGSAAAAGRLVRRLGGELLGFVFLKELGFLKGREKLDARVFTLLE